MQLPRAELRTGIVGRYGSAVFEVHVCYRKSGVSSTSVLGNAGSAAAGVRGNSQEKQVLRAPPMQLRYK